MIRKYVCVTLQWLLSMALPRDRVVILLPRVMAVETVRFHPNTPLGDLMGKQIPGLDAELAAIEADKQQRFKEYMERFNNAKDMP